VIIAMRIPATATLTYPGRACWPQGSLVAVWPVVNIERFVFGQVGPSLQPHLAVGHDIANYGWREYSNRCGLWRVLDMFAELGTPVTAALNAELCQSRPDIASSVRDRGWDVIGHGWENSTPHRDMPPAAEREMISRCLSVLADSIGRPVRGWLTPGFAVSENTFALLAELGVAFNADWCDDDEPYWWETGSGPLLSIPYSLETNDISLILGLHYTPGQFSEAIAEHVRQLRDEAQRDEGAHHNAVVAIGLHPFLVGQPGRIRALRSCFEQLAAMPGVWLTSGSEIADRVTELGQPPLLSAAGHRAGSELASDCQKGSALCPSKIQ
jgi:peptidoglycan/xylan/chitin deacetylase (PgdA/CDA1 family)